MRLDEIGQEIRRARQARGITQGTLASAASITRTTLNQLENGLLKDLGIRKVQTLLEQVGLALDVIEVPAATKPPDFVRLGSTTASVSFKQPMTEAELLHILVTGKVPPSRRPHMRKLLEESPAARLEGLIRQLDKRTPPGKVERNLDKIAAALGIEGSATRWRTKNG